MTDRLQRITVYVDGILDGMPDADERREAYIHTYGVAQCCALLAARRDLGPELATAIGLLHDVYRYKTGVEALHGQNGADMVRVACKYALAGVFSDAEQLLVLSAIYHHSDKLHVHDAYDEVLKDSDILQHLPFSGSHKWIRGQRLLGTLAELGVPTPDVTIRPRKREASRAFDRERFADTAEALAEMRIVGEPTDAAYRRIVRYFPEDTAAAELRSAWCAAFVYHCGLEAGLMLPLRATPTAKLRLACVAAWHTWGMENGLCHADGEGFVPMRGDIVIYNEIIPEADKPGGSLWCDHMGIVLAVEGGALVVAEGNVGNRNVSGVVRRQRDGTVGCYVRVPHGFVCDVGRVDYKTGMVRCEGYGQDGVEQD